MVAVPPLGPKRTAAQMSTGNRMWAWRKGVGSRGGPSRNTKQLSATAVATSATPSRILLGESVSPPKLRQVSSTGATTRSPSASPTHHTRQVSGTCPGRTSPAASSTATPSVALTVVLSAAARTTRARTSTSRSRPRWIRATRVRRATARTASSVFPMPMAIATQKEAPLHALATTAPSITAGQTRTPPTSSAASAIPVGGQTSVANPLTGASVRPSRADRT